MITEYDEIRDKFYMSTWNIQDIEKELRLIERSYNNVWREYSKDEKYNAILEQKELNKKR